MYHALPSPVYFLLENRNDVILLETLKFDSENYRSYLFLDPVETLKIFSPAEVPQMIRRMEDYQRREFYSAGYFGYECGYCFEQIAPLPASREPIAYLGIYAKPFIFNHRNGKWENDFTPASIGSSSQDSGKSQCRISDISLNISEEEYSAKIERIKSHIRAGDTYQINFTSKYVFHVEGSPIALYDELKKKQRVSYAAYLKCGDRTILSLSPELFFRISGNAIQTKPMKGTVKRGRTLEEDERLKKWLANDKKNRAENVMIVDLLRNDIGRISEPGTVTVHDLFNIETYETLFQMTSVVEGRLQDPVTISDLIKSIFPSGSVTGAPKIRSMQIIHELEQERRGVYTGAIGFFSPHNEAVFNVAIRTLVINGKRGEMGVGGGIVYDSTAGDEYRECTLKADFLVSPYREFELVESLLWKDGYPFLEQHLKRLKQSAAFFDFLCNIGEVRRELTSHSQRFAAGSSYKVRLTMNPSGRILIDSTPIHDEQPTGLIAVAGIRTDSNDRFLYHKTTNRDLYERMYREAEAMGLTDYIFLNEKEEITEGTRSNIFIEKNGTLITPPIECGLLNGIYREQLIASRLNVLVRRIKMQEVVSAEAIYICNAVRGLREVKLRSA